MSENDDFETLIWKGMEWMGGWTIAIYGTISLLGAIYGGLFTIYGVHRSPNDPFLFWTGMGILISITVAVYIFRLIYGGKWYLPSHPS